MENNNNSKLASIIKLMPSLYVTILLVSWIFHSYALLTIFLFLGLLSLIAIIAAIVCFIFSWKRENIWQKVIFYWGVVNLLLVGVCVTSPSEQEAMTKKLEKNYERHKIEMDELYGYVSDVLDDDCSILVEFNTNDIGMLWIAPAGEDRYQQFWGDNARAKKDSLLTVVGISDEEFNGLRNRIKNVKCIGLMVSKSGQYMRLMYKRAGMGMYSYLIYKLPLNDEDKEYFLEQSSSIPYSDRVVFDYEGGAFGAQEFGRNIKEKYLKKHQPW